MKLGGKPAIASISSVPNKPEPKLALCSHNAHDESFLRYAKEKFRLSKILALRKQHSSPAVQQPHDQQATLPRWAPA